jgi:hypothetical protein
MIQSISSVLQSKYLIKKSTLLKNPVTMVNRVFLMDIFDNYLEKFHQKK